MNYNILTGKVYVYYGDENNIYIVSSVAYDSRFTKTRNTVIANMKKTLEREAIRNLKASLYEYQDADEDEFNFEWNMTCNCRLERRLEFNDRNELTFVCGAKFQNDNDDIYLGIQIYESIMPMKKFNACDLDAYTNTKRAMTENIKNKIIYPELLENLRVKELVYGTECLVLPDWDWYERNDFMPTIKSISRNLSELYLYESRDIINTINNMKDTFEASDECYVEHFVLDERSTNPLDLCSRIKTVITSGEEMQNNVINGNHDDGSVISISYRLIPVVSSYIEGE